MNRNPWKYGDIAEAIIKFESLGAPDVVKTLQTIQEIVGILDAIEKEDARRAAEREAATKFRKQFETQ